MEITLKKEEEKTVAGVKGRLDAVSAPVFERELQGLIERGDRWVVLDFSGLEYISSAGLRSILAVAKRIRTQNGELAVAALSGEVQKVFDLSGFSTILRVFDTVAAAAARS
jgi:anti-anti-sigma factor